MRLLSAEFCARWAGKLINIHPLLLPRHKGLHTRQRAGALADGVQRARVHGAFRALPGVMKARSSRRRAFLCCPATRPKASPRGCYIEEHQLYPRALAMLARGEAAFA